MMTGSLQDGVNNRRLWSLLDEVRNARHGDATTKFPDSVVADEESQPITEGQAQRVLDLFWASPYPVALQDAQFRFVNVNSEYLALTAYSREQLIGRTPRELGYERIHPCCAADLSPPPNTPPGSHAQLHEGGLTTASGDEKHVRFARRVLQDQVGNVYYFSVVQPIHDKKEHALLNPDLAQEPAVQQREQDVLPRDRELMVSVWHRARQSIALQVDRTRAILDSVLVGIVIVGPLGIQWMNRSAQRMFGGHLVDFINVPISTVATAESDHPFLQTQYLNELAEGRAETFECRVKARDGREFWVVGNVVATGSEQSERQLTYALLDVDRRRRAEARIEQTQASLQRIIEAAPMAITLRDASDLRVLQINETAANIVGRASKDLIGMGLEEMHEPAMAHAMRTDMEEALRASEVTKREYTIVTNGQSRTWDARFMPLSTRSPEPTDNAVGKPDQLLLVATDVTEQRLAEQAKFEAAIAQREMLVKEVHHRIKNNLQGVAGLLQQIAQRKPEVAPAMTEVITQVQAIAQVYGLQVGSGGPLKLACVLQAIAVSVQKTFGHPITLTIETQDGGPDADSWVLPEAESIPVALGLNELLTNAIKHSPSAHTELAQAVTCQMDSLATGVSIAIANRGQLKEDFSLDKVPGGISGLGLVRSLLPRRSATLSLTQKADSVVATVTLTPPGVQISAQAATSTAPAPTVSGTIDTHG